jgi:hypothetical protein
MRRILVCTGILGGGTALVFALAALTAVAFPQGTLVATGWNGGVRIVDDTGGAVGWGRDLVIMEDAAGAVPSSGELFPMVESP